MFSAVINVPTFFQCTAPSLPLLRAGSLGKEQLAGGFLSSCPLGAMPRALTSELE